MESTKSILTKLKQGGENVLDVLGLYPKTDLYTKQEVTNIVSGTLAPSALVMPSSQEGTGLTEFPLSGQLGSAAFTDLNMIPAQMFVEVKSSAYQILPSDSGKVFIVSGTTTLTLPDCTFVFNLSRGFNVTVKAKTGSTVTLARLGSDTIDTVAGNLSITAGTAKRVVPEIATNWESF
jgi:hypothetical protein